MNKNKDKNKNIMIENSVIEKVFEDLRNKNQKAFIPFITCGFPDCDGFLSLFETLDENGADIIEVGIPFSDPLADGPVIQTTSEIALKNGVNTDTAFKTIDRIRKKSDTPIAIMTYFNIIYRYGLKKFLKNAENTGVNALIIPDLPTEEFDAYKDNFNRAGIDNIIFASLNSSKERLKAVTEKGRGFLYCVSVKGVTGVRNDLDPEVVKFLKDLRRITDLPLALGFGLSNEEQIKKVRDYCDGIIMGSKILSMILESRSFKDGIKSVEAFVSDINKILK
ncbi:MAG: tryptophan synthase subunit alpha [Candidatus Humimicrobiaceae bacterium]|jgi:tryptophan synthase alpha chain|nr:tryptophan synthase subunit alpha [Candidatus Humimicrobiaceae bacterium]